MCSKCKAVFMMTGAQNVKKAFSTLACLDLNYKEIAEYAAAAGISAIEVRLHQGNRLFDLSLEDVPEALAYLNEKNITITNLGTNVDICDYLPDTIASAKDTVDLATLTKAKGIRVFIGSFRKRFSEENVHNYEGIVKSLKEICEYAKQRNVEIWVETHSAFSTGKVLKGLLDDVVYDNLKVIWDIMHSYEYGETLQETLDYLGDRIVHIHIKDGVKKEDPDLIIYRYTKLGEGNLPIREMVSLMQNAGYQGYYSLEWENAWREEIKYTFGSLSGILEHFNLYMDSLYI
jgi:sugar phosphate isomerase/epimerase